MGNETENKGRSLDLIGLGETAKAIPKEVYTATTNAIISKFSDIVSPITETTSGIGRYIRQKFDNMVEAEKVIAAVTLENAINKAKNQSDLIKPKHLKSFINSFEEASKESDPLLHEMWENLIASQLIESEFHPHFAKILSHFSPAEANLLLNLNEYKDLGEDFSYYLGNPISFKNYVIKNHDQKLNNWTYSCELLVEFGFAAVAAPNREIYKDEDHVTILHRTSLGNKFLKTVITK
ncbi:Abi-alpha family protein [Tenacibaculum finnmarkense]|uniref:Abi-alpha family protein n=1 Tax=Tenacibaculum finnmarkense TaxID=2781243 RepID=UPI001E4A972D|nr:Abi-alpha family protein [Tenacibaculum finnmarkense]MCD8401407.1 DUF4393 domain-containing protein [Tenacibaculum finnmarkense genomovar ulcerans]